MQISIALFSIVVFASTAALGEDDCRCWTPSIEDVAALEARIKDRPTPFGELDRYVRYYGGIIGSGDRRRFIMGKLVPPTGIDAPGIQIVAGKLPPLQGEGCVSNTDDGFISVALALERGLRTARRSQSWKMRSREPRRSRIGVPEQHPASGPLVPTTTRALQEVIAASFKVCSWPPSMRLHSWLIRVKEAPEYTSRAKQSFRWSLTGDAVS